MLRRFHDFTFGERLKDKMHKLIKIIILTKSALSHFRMKAFLNCWFSSSLMNISHLPRYR